MSTKPAIILVHPQMGENIGFTARNMGNFGFADLRIVNPRDGWPNKLAEPTAAKSIDIVKNARIFDSVAEAIEDLEFIYATSARTRDLNKEHISTKDLKSDIKQNNIKQNKLGILIGSERSGLDNDSISYANKIVYIPTDAKSPSINIAIASGILCYELSEMNEKTIKPQDLATKKEINNLVAHLEKMLDKTNFYKVPEKRKKMQNNIQNIFQRIQNLNSNEVNTLIGVLKSLFNHSK